MVSQYRLNIEQHRTLYRKLQTVLIIVVLSALFIGFLLGFLVHRCFRAFSDVAAEDARRRFQAMYADPNTEIEDLPSSLPGYVREELSSWAQRCLDLDSAPGFDIAGRNSATCFSMYMKKLQ